MDRLAACAECLPRPTTLTQNGWIRRVRNRLTSQEADALKLKERRKKQVKNLKTFCKQFFAFLFSHIGLSLLIVGYTFVGGLMFRELEHKNEVKLKIDTAAKMNQTFEALVNVYTIYGTVNDTTRFRLKRLLGNYTEYILEAVDSGWSKNTNITDTSWSFPGAVLYAVTVITTIGYGHVAPKTDGGKFLTMIYALVGIPLTFLFLSNIGDYLATVFRLLYVQICRRCCQKIKKSHIRRQLASAYATKAALSGRLPGHNWSQQAHSSSKANSTKPTEIGKNEATQSSVNRNFYNEGYDPMKDGPIPNLQAKFYCYARLLPGFKSKNGHNVSSTLPGPPIGTVQLANWTDFDQDMVSMDEEFCDRLLAVRNNQINTNYFQHNNSIANSNDSFKIELSVDNLSPTDNANNNTTNPQSTRKTAEIETVYRPPLRSIESDHRIRHNKGYRLRRLSYLSVGDEFCELDKETIYGLYGQRMRSSKKKEKITVPISLSLSIIVIYIVIGSILFNYWSNEPRDILKWSYFCFITLSTIGFGDIVPGTKIDSDNPQEKMVVVSLYVAIGLSVFAMCFKLMQEEVVSKVKWMGRRLGAIRNKR